MRATTVSTATDVPGSTTITTVPTTGERNWSTPALAIPRILRAVRLGLRT